MRYNGTNFNCESVAKKTVQDWIEWAKPRYPKFSEEQLQEIHELSTLEVAKEEISSEATNSPPASTGKQKATAKKK